MKKITLSQITKNIIYLALITLSLNTSAQASVVNPTTSQEDGGIIKQDKCSLIIAVNEDTKEMESFDNMNTSEAISRLSSGKHQITIYSDNKKIQFIYTKE
jgi:hypothetical protein